MAGAGMNLITIDAGGKITRTAHDGTFQTNSGREPVRNCAGMVMHRVRAPCVDCGAHYFFWRLTKRRVYRCPACWSEYGRKKSRRYAREHAGAIKTQRAAARTRRLSGRKCAECGVEIPVGRHANARYCGPACKSRGNAKINRECASRWAKSHRARRNTQSREWRRRNAAPRPQRNCNECGTEIPADQHPLAKFCGAECRRLDINHRNVMAYRRRVEAA